MAEGGKCAVEARIEASFFNSGKGEEYLYSFKVAGKLTCKVSFRFLKTTFYIVRLLVATLHVHVGMTGKQDGSYTQLA